jgi:CRP/FNR family cyclic AMP-dependent transcriptional regulator
MVTVNALKSIPLFAGLRVEQLAALASEMTVHRFRRSAFILRAGENSDGFYVILSGRAKVLIPGEEGSEVILATLGRGDFFGEMGLLDHHPRSASVQALAPCELMRLVEADLMRRLSDNSGLAMCIMRELVKRLRQANRQIESLALWDVNKRVARLLLELSENIGGERVITKAPAKQEIAYMVGASREMVSRVISDLRNAGDICVDKRRIVLLEKSARR